MSFGWDRSSRTSRRIMCTATWVDKLWRFLDSIEFRQSFSRRPIMDSTRKWMEEEVEGMMMIIWIFQECGNWLEGTSDYFGGHCWTTVQWQRFLESGQWLRDNHGESVNVSRGQGELGETESGDINEKFLCSYDYNVLYWNSSLELGKTKIDARHNFWHFNDTLAVRGRIRDYFGE